MRRALNGAPLSLLCTRLRRWRHCAIRPFTSTSLLWMRFAMAASVSALSPRKSCTGGFKLLEQKILAFSSPGYPAALRPAVLRRLTPDLVIRTVRAPLFLATTLHDFEGGNRGDVRTSKDLEDIISVVDGRPILIDEVEA